MFGVKSSQLAILNEILSTILSEYIFGCFYEWASFCTADFIISYYTFLATLFDAQ